MLNRLRIEEKSVNRSRSQAHTAQDDEPHTGVRSHEQDEAEKEGCADDGKPGSAAVAAHGNVQVVFQPAGQTDVPSFPKFTDVAGLIGRPEVDGQVESHEQGNTNGHIRISTEVGIHLKAVGVQADEVFKSTVTTRIGEHPIDDVDREVIGQPDFFDQTVEDPKQPRSKFKSAEAIGLMKLRDEGLGAYDGPCDELRKKLTKNPKSKTLRKGSTCLR